MAGETLVFRLLNMSLTGGAIILLLLAFRPFLRRLPKKYLCLFWLIPIFRLLVPVSIPAPFSLLPVNPEPLVKTTAEGVGVAALDTGIGFIDIPVNLVLVGQQVPENLTSVNPLQVWIWVFLRLWAAGAVIFLAVHFFRYWKLKRKAAEAIPGELGVYYSDRLSMPMVLGIVKPRIYMPSFFLKEEYAGEKELVLAHEKAHMKRRDHWTKFLAFLVLAAHWFNPLVWAAYFMLCRDMEMACDELVMETLGEGRKKEYSLALLHFEERRSLLLLPLAFGESHTKARIKNILNYRAPRFWIRLACAGLLVFAAWTLLADPREPENVIGSGANSQQPDGAAGAGDPSTVIIGGADGPTSIFLAGKGTEDPQGEEAEPVDVEAIKTQPYGTDVELDYVSAGKIALHGYFGYLVFTIEEARDGSLSGTLYRSASLSEIGGIQMQGDGYTEIIGGDGAAMILPGIYGSENENPAVYLYIEESGVLEQQGDFGEEALDSFIESLRGMGGGLADAAVEEGLLGVLEDAARSAYGSGTAILYGPVAVPEYDANVYGFLAADGGNVEDLWYGLWWEGNGRIEQVRLFE